ncbi:hypothetical protein [Pseudoflavonifractor sp. 60]|uniref:hypothetical protein n=1 Tax=Pseudoflavonifractor sp. 60 TaxID=2304576 RepID=UPI0013690424|nr:hypothetical protein [Pseudoflavonifractor sp. 60]
MICIDGKKVKKCFLGDEAIGRVYLGDALIFQKAPRLPAEYTELQYIKNPNLGYVLLSTLNPVYTKTWFPDIKIELTVSDLIGTGDVNILGSYIRYSGNYWCSSLVYYSSSNSRYTFLQGQTSSNAALSRSISRYIPYSKTDKATIIIDRPITQRFSVNGAEQDISGTYITTEANLRDPVILGSYGKVGTTGPVGSNYAFYGLKAYDSSNQLVSEIVPVIKGDGTVGLFDIVTYTFSSPTNKTLVAGPEI